LCFGLRQITHRVIDTGETLRTGWILRLDRNESLECRQSVPSVLTCEIRVPTEKENFRIRRIDLKSIIGVTDRLLEIARRQLQASETDVSQNKPWIHSDCIGPC